MPIVPRQFPAIVSDLRDRVTTSLPTLDTSEGTFYRLATIDPFALELEDIEDLLLRVQQSQSLLTATGQDLDLLAFNYNVQRRGSQRASGFAQFFVPVSGFTTPITIPKGTSITSLSGIPYETLLEGVINGFAQQTTRGGITVYEITIPISALTSGTSGNGAARILSTVVGFPNVAVTNDSAIDGGYDEEPDDSLATRAILSFGIWSRGVKAAVEFGARLVPGVYYASAVYAYAGHFDLFVSDQAGNLSDQMQSAVDDILVEWAAAGVGWTVKRPPLFLLNTTIKVAFRSSANLTTQINAVRSDVATVINASKTHRIYLDDFHADLRTRLSSYVAHWDLDAPSEHVLRPEGEIIRSGTVTVVDTTGLI